MGKQGKPSVSKKQKQILMKKDNY